MALNQLHVAKEIVTLTYALLLGAVALGMALAFGLGGREVASTMLNDAYSKGQQNKDQVKQDMQPGKDRGQNLAEEGKQRAQSEVGQGGGQGGTGSSAAQRFRG